MSALIGCLRLPPAICHVTWLPVPSASAAAPSNESTHSERATPSRAGPVWTVEAGSDGTQYGAAVFHVELLTTDVRDEKRAERGWLAY